MKYKQLVKFLMLTLLTIPLASPLTAHAKTAELSWQQLRPTLAPFNDPFKLLTKDQIDDLGYFVALSDDILAIEKQAPDYPKLPKLKSEQSQLKGELLAQNIDIDYLLSQREVVKKRREQEATAINSNELVKQKSFKGYLVPITYSNNFIKTAFLVKDSPNISIAHQHYVPEPNQTIFVDLSELSVKPSTDKLTVNGILDVGETKATLKTQDNHEVEYHAAYKMESISIGKGE